MYLKAKTPQTVHTLIVPRYQNTACFGTTSTRGREQLSNQTISPPPCSSMQKLCPTSHRICSVLLGRREPPSAASVLRDTQDCSHQGEGDSADPPGPDSAISMESPASSLHSFDENRNNSNTGPSTAATTLEALPSQLVVSPRRYRRLCNDNANPGHAAQPQQPPKSGARSHRVRFDVYNEDEGLGTGVGLPEPLQHREHGSIFAQEEGESGLGREQAQDVGSEASLSSEDLAGPVLLQVCAIVCLKGAWYWSIDYNSCWGRTQRITG